MKQEAWPAYTLAAPASLELNLTSAARLDVQAPQCAFWDVHPYYGQESITLRAAKRLRAGAKLAA